jgi:uncharacterized membrane protein YcaP (DUF421 family)
MDAKIFSDMFVLAVPVLEKILRPIIVYFALIVGLRLAGKRTLAQLNPFDLVVLLTLSNTVQNAIIGEDNTVTGGLIGAATLLLINYLVVRFVYRENKIDKLIEGGEDVLIENGQVNQVMLDRNTISLNELTIAARRQGFDTLDEVERAVLEPEGGITFQAKHPDPETSRHQELLSRIDILSAQLAELHKYISDQQSGNQEKTAPA